VCPDARRRLAPGRHCAGRDRPRAALPAPIGPSLDRAPALSPKGKGAELPAPESSFRVWGGTVGHIEELLWR
jgi:hypothetical protein